jgi:hypothetical protein
MLSDEMPFYLPKKSEWEGKPHVPLECRPVNHSDWVYG